MIMKSPEGELQLIINSMGIESSELQVASNKDEAQEIMEPGQLRTAAVTNNRGIKTTTSSPYNSRNFNFPFFSQLF